MIQCVLCHDFSMYVGSCVTCTTCRSLSMYIKLLCEMFCVLGDAVGLDVSYTLQFTESSSHVGSFTICLNASVEVETTFHLLELHMHNKILMSFAGEIDSI